MNREELNTLKAEVSKQFSGTTKYSKAFRRGNSQALDISQTFPTFAHAFAYALNDTDSDNYVPYAGQVVSVADSGKVYILRKYSPDIVRVALPDSASNEYYDLKDKSKSHFYLQEIQTKEDNHEKFLSAEADSSNEGHKLTIGSLEVEGKNGVGADIHAKGNISADGNVTGKNISGENLNVSKKVTTPEIEIGDKGIHTNGADAQSGFSLSKEASGGYTMYVDNLKVRNKMSVENLEVQETRYVGGKQILTAGSGFTCIKVESGLTEGGDGFTCYFKNEENGRVKYNSFQVGDLALCESFENNHQKFYWREVVACGENYIVISNIEGRYHADSDIPEVGDVIVHCGNKNGGERSNAIVLSAIDSTSPFIAQYKNIVTFEWPEPVTKLSNDGNILTGTLISESGIQVDKYINDTNETISKLQEGMQGFEDDNFEIWQITTDCPKDEEGNVVGGINSDEISPSKDWNLSELSRHSGDYIIFKDGVVYSLRSVAKDVYVWMLVTDQYLIDALGKAINAQQTADGAVQRLDDIIADGKITPEEKLALKKIWDGVVSRYNQINEEATRHNIDSTKGVRYFYNATYTALKVIVDAAIAYDGTYIIADADDYKSLWGNYYTLESSMYKTIEDAINEDISNAEEIAKTSKERLDDIVSDGKITLEEHSALREILRGIDARYVQLVEEAYRHEISESDEGILGKYISAYENLTSVLETALAATSTYTIEDKNAYKTLWETYYTCESELYAEIERIVNKKVNDANDIAADADDKAQTSLDKIRDMASDKIITLAEKPSLINLFSVVANTYTKLISEAAKYGITSENKKRSDYEAAYSSLQSRMATIFESTDDYSLGTDEEAAQYTNLWSNYYSCEAALYTAIYTAAKKLSDDAQTTANTAKSDAERALDKLQMMAADNVITLQEKLSLKTIWDGVTSTYTQLTSKANEYEITYTGYTTAYNNLKTLIDKILPSTTDYTLTDEDKYSEKWTAYYSAEASLYNSVIETTKLIADNAKDAADEAAKTATSAKDRLDAMADDGKITVEEVDAIKKIFVQATSDKNMVVADALKYDIDSSELTDAWSLLQQILTPIFETTDEGNAYEFTGTEKDDYDSAWNRFYSKLNTVSNKVTIASKKVATDAQQTADGAVQRLDDIASDDKITPEEKTDLKEWWDNEKKEASSIIANNEKAYSGNESQNFERYRRLTELADILMTNVLSNMNSTTDISTTGSIFVDKVQIQRCFENNKLTGSHSNGGYTWKDFWQIYYEYKGLASNVAEAKARVFITDNYLPTPPYKYGDLWICVRYTNGNDTYTNETFTCINNKLSADANSNFSDWKLVTTETSSHLEKLKEAIKLWVEQDSDLATKIKSGIDILADGVHIYANGVDKGSLFSVGTDGTVKINASLLDISSAQITFTGDEINLNAGNGLKITSPQFNVDRYGNVTAANITCTGGVIGGFNISNQGLVARGESTYMIVTPQSLMYGENLNLEGSKYFLVRPDGSMIATNATITGEINANSGTIAGMKINTGEVSYKQQSQNGGYFGFGWNGVSAGFMQQMPDGTYAAVTTTHIDKDGTFSIRKGLNDSPSIEFKPSGKGHVANGNIAWDEDGNADFRGTIHATDGEFEGEVKAKIMYSKTGVIDTPNFYIDPASNPCSTFRYSGRRMGDTHLYLPSAEDYDGLEINVLTWCAPEDYNYFGNIYQYVSTQNGEHLYFKRNSYMINVNNVPVSVGRTNIAYTKGTYARMALCQYFTFKAIGGAWVATEGIFGVE